MDNEISGDTATIDMDAGVSEIASGLGLGGGSDESADDDLDLSSDDTNAAAATDETGDNADGATDAPADSEAAAAATAEEKAVRAMPKSWAKDTEELWNSLPDAAKEQFEKREKQMLDGLEQYKGDAGYGRQMREVTQPYESFIKSQGVDAPKAVQYLLNAHYRLSTAPAAEKQQYFAHMAKSYGIDLTGMKPAEGAAELPPEIRSVQEDVRALKERDAAREAAAQEEARQKIANEVQTFAQDPKNKYFDECADEIAALIQAGHTLEAAYEKAVYANPVTRAKEIARLQAEAEKSLREKSKRDAETARKAAGVNVRSRDTRKAPTEPKGSMEDTMRSTLSEIRGRTH